MSLHSRLLSRRALVGAALSLPLALASCGGQTSTTSSDGSSASAPAVAEGVLTEPIEGAYASGKHHVAIDVKDFGTIEFELDADVAPVTVSNFCDLAASGFYDGLTFHRIINGFMIQGGDPLGNGTGGSSRLILGEFAENGIDNPISHKRGVISMARAYDLNSASSQFFIVHQDSDFLDGSYAAFGTVTEGIEVVDAIATTVPVQDDNGTVNRADQPTITSIKVID